MLKPSKKLIKETQGLIRIKIFFEQEVGLKIDLSTRELKRIVRAIIS